MEGGNIIKSSTLYGTIDHIVHDLSSLSIDKAIKVYTAAPHEGLKNVSPNDVYTGRKEAILKARQERKG